MDVLKFSLSSFKLFEQPKHSEKTEMLLFILRSYYKPVNSGCDSVEKFLDITEEV